MLSWAANSGGPPNDLFAAAQVISGTQGMVDGTNVAATSEGEPQAAGYTVWYRWTAPQTTCVVFDTYQRTSVPNLAINVFTGDSVTALIGVANTYHRAGADTDVVAFQATAGVTYSIEVDGDPGTGTFVLQWALPDSGPGNNLFAMPNRSVS